jgi:hypothetical protein
MEYFESLIAWVILSILGTDVEPLSMALRGKKPQHVVAKTIESKIGRYPGS